MSGWIILGLVIGVPLAIVGGVVALFVLLEFARPIRSEEPLDVESPQYWPPMDGPTMIGPGDPLYGSPHRGDATATGSGQWR